MEQRNLPAGTLQVPTRTPGIRLPATVYLLCRKRDEHKRSAFRGALLDNKPGGAFQNGIGRNAPDTPSAHRWSILKLKSLANLVDLEELPPSTPLKANGKYLADDGD